jgi:hypothetical protein
MTDPDFLWAVGIEDTFIIQATPPHGPAPR